MDWIRTACLGQGCYFLLTSVWPLLHMRSFLAVTGPKTDLWLVKTVAALLLVIAITLLLAVTRNSLTVEIRTLAIATAVALLTVDVTYAMKKIISPIYLADAAAEGMFIALWLVYYHENGLGSMIALTDASGNVVERYTYDVYGKPTFKDGAGNVIAASAHGNRFLFTGREWLPKLSLYDYRNY